MLTISLLGDVIPDSLTLVSFLNKQKISILSEALNLATKAGNQEAVEKEMTRRAETMIRQFRIGKIKWSEYQKAAIVQSLVGAMAGAETANMDDQIRESVWNQAVGHMAQHLPGFLKDVKDAMERGDLKEDAAEDFVEDFWDEGDEEDKESDPYYPLGAGYIRTGGPPRPAAGLPGGPEGWRSAAAPSTPTLSKPRRSGPRKAIASWAGVANRLIRFIANPSYGFFRLAEYNVQKKTGMTQMRRVAVKDDRTCPDCIWWDEVGWQRIGEIPLPGNSCRCMDRCRCRTEYR